MSYGGNGKLKSSGVGKISCGSNMLIFWRILKISEIPPKQWVNYFDCYQLLSIINILSVAHPSTCLFTFNCY
jgi:hypothetical protein